MASPLTLTPATDLVRLVASSRVSAEELVSAHLDAIRRVNPSINAFVDLRAEAALADARAQDEAARSGRRRGPLGGLPVTIKSALEVAGLRCESGSPSRKDIVAEK